ncbi:MAG: DUF86 domain-containing protein [SAR324 cluster bacterium]|nr:DUF86 domain-containing protein [SAR324 cluster bacterium]
MDEMILLVKMESLNHCLDRIQSKMPISQATLQSDWDLQDIVTLNLQRAIQICVDIASHINAELSLPAPMNMSESFMHLEQAKVISPYIVERMKKSVGFRNILVHAYESVDWNIVHAILTQHLQDFKRYAKEVLDWYEYQRETTELKG